MHPGARTVSNCTGSSMKTSTQILTGTVLGLAYFAWCCLIDFEIIQMEGSWGGFTVFLLGLPASAISLLINYFIPKISPLITYGLIGSVWWFFLGYYVTGLFRTEHTRRFR